MHISAVDDTVLIAILSLGNLLLTQLLGFSVTLLARLPALRRIGRSSPRARLSLVGLISLLAFMVTLGVHTYLESRLEYALASVRAVSGPPPAQWEARKTAILTELWLRASLPPLSAQPCYSAGELVCGLVDEILKLYVWSGDLRWGYWWRSVIFSLLVLPAAWGWGWRFTR